MLEKFPNSLEKYLYADFPKAAANGNSRDDKPWAFSPEEESFIHRIAKEYGAACVKSDYYYKGQYYAGEKMAFFSPGDIEAKNAFLWVIKRPISKTDPIFHINLMHENMTFEMTDFEVLANRLPRFLRAQKSLWLQGANIQFVAKP